MIWTLALLTRCGRADWSWWALTVGLLLWISLALRRTLLRVALTLRRVLLLLGRILLLLVLGWRTAA